MTPDEMTALGGFLTGVIGSLIALFTYFRSARTSALSEANAQIAQQGGQIATLNSEVANLRSKNNAMWDLLQDERAQRASEREQWARERLQLRERFEIAVLYVRKLLSIMRECNIAAPAMPDELEQFISEMNLSKGDDVRADNK